MEKMVSTLVELRKGKMSEEECRKLPQAGQLLRHHAGEDGLWPTLCWAAPPIPPPTRSVPPCRSSRPSPATRSCPPASFWSVPLPPATARFWPWATAPSTSSPPRMSWWRSAWRPPSAAKVFGIDPKVAYLSYSTQGSGKGEDVDKMRNACEQGSRPWPPIWPWTASCSSTPPSLPAVAQHQVP